MCDDEIFNFEEDPCTSSFQYEEPTFIQPDNVSARAPPPSPEGLRKQVLPGKHITMDQLAKELSSLRDPDFPQTNSVRPRAETISTIPLFQDSHTREFFQHKFMSIESQGYFGCFKSQDYEEDEMECEDSFQAQMNIPHSLHIPNSLNIRAEFEGPFNPFTPGGSCDPSPVSADNHHIPFVMGGISSDGFKKNSLKRRTNDKLLNSPYPHPGQECSDISKKSRSARSSPPFILYSHLSQSAPR